mgnify:CR=1
MERLLYRDILEYGQENILAAITGKNQDEFRYCKCLPNLLYNIAKSIDT